MCERRDELRPGIDRCIANELLRLNLNGVETVSSCCGHGEEAPFVLIRGEVSRQRAEALGYRPDPHLPALNDAHFSIRPTTGDHSAAPDPPKKRVQIFRRMTATQRRIWQGRYNEQRKARR